MDSLEPQYLRRAIALASDVGAAGEFLLVSLLVLDGAVMAEEHRTDHSEDDIRVHSELKLARWAARCSR